MVTLPRLLLLSYCPNDDDITLADCSFTVTGEGQGIIARGGTVTIKDGTEITTQGTSTAITGDVSYALNSSAIVYDASNSSYAGYSDTESKITINGGTFTSSSSIPVISVYTDTTDERTLNSDDATSRVSVSGGTYSTDPSQYAATGYEATGADGVYTVEVADDAEDDYVYYTTEADGDKTFLDEDDITIGDGSYYVPKDFSDKSVTYTRTFSNTTWNSWFVPFDVDATNEDVEFYKIVAALADETSGDIYISITKVESGTILANVPYIIKPQAEATVSFTATGLYATGGSTRKQKDVSTATSSDNYVFTGIYTQTSPTGWYALSTDGDLSQQTSEEGHALSPFRFYLTVTAKDSDPYAEANSSVKGGRTIKIVETDGDEATAISQLQTAVGATKNAEIYDLQGRRVQLPGKGLYIVNGKKVLFN